MFNASYNVLLYDLTSTYFECDVPENEGLPVAYEVMPGNTSDKTTLPEFLRKIEKQYGKMNRKKLRKARRGEGTYLLRTNLTAGNPEDLWKQYIVLTEVEQAFKELKNDLDTVLKNPVFSKRPSLPSVGTRKRLNIF